MRYKSVFQKLIDRHLVFGSAIAGEEIGVSVDQTLTQDATGTLVGLCLESMKLDEAKTELSVQYIDHNLLQLDHKNPDDHLFLKSVCEKYGIIYSKPGNGISHVVHMENFGKPGASLLGSDSHTCAAGAIGMLAIGAGGLDVAMAIAGRPFRFRMPKTLGIRITNKLSEWVSAKDIVLEVLRRYGVAGGVGKVVEYFGPGLDNLTVMDRHVIANMGAELGATTSIFPSDMRTKEYLKMKGREGDWFELMADEKAAYDMEDEIDLRELDPLIACPSSPGNVAKVKEVSGRSIYQSYIGSSANPGDRDFSIVAKMLDGEQVAPNISLDINPTSHHVITTLIKEGYLNHLLQAGGKLHQTGCNGCIGMGQAPATNKISLRTVPRNFPGRSGTREDKVYLCSPETAAASAIKGKITDPRDLDKKYPAEVNNPLKEKNIAAYNFIKLHRQEVQLEKGPNIRSLPQFDKLKEDLFGQVFLRLGDHISTDEILPAGSEVLPFRSNIYEISKF